jgi:hypothetical protein
MHITDGEDGVSNKHNTTLSPSDLFSSYAPPEKRSKLSKDKLADG